MEAQSHGGSRHSWRLGRNLCLRPEFGNFPVGFFYSVFTTRFCMQTSFGKWIRREIRRFYSRGVPLLFLSPSQHFLHFVLGHILSLVVKCCDADQLDVQTIALSTLSNLQLHGQRVSWSELLLHLGFWSFQWAHLFSHQAGVGVLESSHASDWQADTSTAAFASYCWYTCCILCTDNCNVYLSSQVLAGGLR